MKTIRIGDKGASVTLAQERFNAKGWSVAVDGIFGKEVDEATRQFQASNGRTVDGVIGPNTWADLLAKGQVGSPDEVLNEARTDLLNRFTTRAQSQDAPVFGAAAACYEAIEWLGDREVPDGANTGPELGRLVDGYNEHWGISGSKRYPWCAIAVSQWIRMGLGIARWADTPMKNWFGGVAQWEDWAKTNGVFVPVESGLSAPVGAVFTMARTGSGSDPSTSIKNGHCGLVLWSEGDEVVSIDGNSSNRVREVRRSVYALRGFVKWWEKL